MYPTCIIININNDNLLVNQCSNQRQCLQHQFVNVFFLGFSTPPRTRTVSVPLAVGWVSIGPMVSVVDVVPWGRGRLGFDPHRVHRNNRRLLALVHTQARTHCDDGDRSTGTRWLRCEGSWSAPVWPACNFVTAQSPSWSNVESVSSSLETQDTSHYWTDTLLTSKPQSQSTHVISVYMYAHTTF